MWIELAANKVEIEHCRDKLLESIRTWKNHYAQEYAVFALIAYRRDLQEYDPSDLAFRLVYGPGGSIEAVGYARVEMNKNGHEYLNIVYIASSGLRKGQGTELMNSFVDTANEDHIDIVVFPDPDALKFYSQWGARQKGLYLHIKHRGKKV